LAGALGAQAERRLRMAIQVGDQAPDFDLPAHDDRRIALASFRGRPVVVAFMPFAFTGG
jgi:peroxiredoxin